MELRDITTPVGQFSFPHLAEPSDATEAGGRCQTELLIKKEVWSKEGKPLAQAILAIGQENIKIKKDGKLTKPTKLSEFTQPVQDGDKLADEKGNEAYRGCVVIRAKWFRQNRPPVCDGNLVDLEKEEVAAIQGGDWGRLVVTPFYYDKGDKGVSLGIELVQFWKKAAQGESFGGGTPVSVLKESKLSKLEVPLEDVELEEEDEFEEEPKARRGRKAGSKNKTNGNGHVKKAVEEHFDEEPEEDESEEFDLSL